MEQYISKLRTQLESASSISNAIPMKKYMKNQFEYLGIKSPERKLILSNFFREYGLPDQNIIGPIIKSLWHLPQREYQYCAMSLAEKKIKVVENDFLEVIEYMIEQKSWWDTVDFVAAVIAGKFFNQFQDLLPEVPDRWSASENMWYNRSAILYQLKYKSKTDTEALTRYILPHADSKEFFIQKSIGWALREYSKTNADWVRSFVSKNKLKPLSKREGLKWLDRQVR